MNSKNGLILNKNIFSHENQFLKSTTSENSFKNNCISSNNENEPSKCYQIYIIILYQILTLYIIDIIQNTEKIYDIKQKTNVSNNTIENKENIECHNENKNNNHESNNNEMKFDSRRQLIDALEINDEVNILFIIYFLNLVEEKNPTIN